MRALRLRVTAAVLFLLVGAASGLGCNKVKEILAIEPEADLANPQSVQVAGVAFELPGNWTWEQETENVEDQVIHTLTAESSGSGLAMVQIFPPAIEVEPAEMLQTILDALPGSLDELGVGKLAGIEARGQRDVSRTFPLVAAEPREGRAARYALTMLGEKVPHQMEVFTFHDDERTLALYFQWAKEDAEKTRPVFEHLARTLKLSGSEAPGAAAPGAEAPGSVAPSR